MSQSLMQLLRDQHVAALADLVEKAQTEKVVAEYRRLNSVAGFVEFCEKFLADNPVTEVFYPGSGVGIKLGRDHACVITDVRTADAEAKPGETLDAGAIGII